MGLLGNERRLTALRRAFVRKKRPNVVQAIITISVSALGAEATAASLIAYFAFGYLGHRFITFRSKSRTASTAHFAVQLIALLIAATVTSVVVSALQQSAGESFFLSALAAAVFSYVCQKRWVFSSV